MNTFTLNLDLDKRFENDYVRIRQGDQNGTTIVANIYDHGTALDGTGLTARIRMRLPDGEHFYEKDATLSGNMATVTIDETQAASVSGTTDNAYFQILSGSTVIASTQDFTVRVLRDATSDAEVGENYSTQIQQAIDSLNDMTATIPEKVVDEVDAQLAAHPEWTTTVEDNSLTDAKLIQKGGILQREQWLESLVPVLKGITKETAEADVHYVTDSAGGGPLGITVYGRSTQDGTPTPDAPVAIQSVEPDSEGNISLWASGFNQWDEQWENGIYLSDTGLPYASANNIRSKNYIAIFPTMDYYLKLPYSIGSSGVCLVFYDADKSIVKVMTKWFNLLTTSDIPASAAYMRFSTNNSATPTYNNDICINISDPSRNGTYTPYVGSTIPIDLGGRSLRSLPDGTRDEVNVDEWGHAILTQRVFSLTLDGVNYKLSHNSNGYCSGTYSLMKVSPSDGTATWVQCDRFPRAVAAGSCYVANQVFVIRYGNGFNPTSQAELNAWFQANPTTFQFALATPVTVDLGHLDPALLPAPDLTAYVVPSAPSVLRYGYTVAESTSSNLAPVETSPATASHAAGTLLTLDGQLVKVTSAIAVGEAVTIGGNVRTTTIAAELAALA